MLRVRLRTVLAAGALAALGLLLVQVLSVGPALAQTGAPIKAVSTLVTGCYTVDATTGGTRIPTSPAANRIGFAMFSAGANRAYCVPTTATSCSTPASITNYGMILEPAAGADQLGTFWSAWLLNSTSFCCATVAGTTKVCIQEGVL
jgi:hypothetical protein